MAKTTHADGHEPESAADDADRAAPFDARPRRASLQSAFFSLATTSDFFREIRFRPTKIVGILFLSDPKPDPASVRRKTVDRLLSYPRFRSYVRLEDDPVSKRMEVRFHPLPLSEIDLGYHYRNVDGGGTMTEEDDVSEMVSEAHLLDWDVDKPLWRLTLITNMKDGRSMLFCVVDHTIGDGAFLSALMVSLFDKDNDDADADGDAGKKPNEKAHQPEEKGAASQSQAPARGVARWRLSHRLLSFAHAVYQGCIGNFLLPVDPENSLKFSVEDKRAAPKGRKTSATRHFPLGEVKAIKNRLPGATVNDVVTAVATIAMRRYYERTGEDVHLLQGGGGGKGKEPIQVTIAIAYRDKSTTMDELVSQGGSNSVVAGAFIPPLTFASPIDAVWRCKARMDVFKRTPLVPIAHRVNCFLTGWLPWKALEQVGLDVYFRPTACFSNVMGPPQRASIGGYGIDDFAFYGMAPGQGTYLGILSYSGRVRMFVSMDKHVTGDPDVLRACLEEAYDEVRVATEEARPSALVPPDSTPFLARLLEVAFPVLLAAGVGWMLVANQ